MWCVTISSLESTPSLTVFSNFFTFFLSINLASFVPVPLYFYFLKVLHWRFAIVVMYNVYYWDFLTTIETPARQHRTLEINLIIFYAGYFDQRPTVNISVTESEQVPATNASHLSKFFLNAAPPRTSTLVLWVRE